MAHTLPWLLVVFHLLGGPGSGVGGMVPVPSSARPQEAEAQMQAGMAALNVGDWGRAVAAFERALEAREPPPQAHLYLGVALWRTGRLEDAARTLETATGLLPRSAEAHLFLGLVRFELRRLPAAREALRRAASRDPTSASARLGLARVHLNLAQLQRGIGEVEVAARLEPDNAAIHTTRALLAFRGGDLETARSAVTRALELDPDDAEARALRVEIALQEDDFAAARPLATELVEERPTDPRYRYLLASALSGLGDDDEAAEEFRSYRALRSVTEDPTAGGMATGAGAAGPTATAGSAAAARPVGAAGATDRSRRRAIAASLVQRAEQARRDGDGEMAELLARLAEDIDGSLRPAALRILGLVHYERNEFEAASRRMQELWDQGHRSASLAHDLVLSLIQSGQPGRAATLLGPLLDDPAWEGAGDAVLHYLRATALLEAGRPEEAVQAASRAVELDPELPSPHLVLSRAYERLGRPEEAEREMELYRRLLGRRRFGAPRRAQ